MSKAQSNSDESNRKEYRITLSDIKGVGPATIDKLESVDITNVRELHLLKHGKGSATANLMRKENHTIGSDTWNHLRAVGKAVKGVGPAHVRTKHLTGDIANEKANSRDVRIDIPRETSEDSEETDIPQYDTDTLQTALNAIHAEFGEEYGEQVRFEADIGRFLHESDTFNGEDHKLPQGIIQSVMRYRHIAETVEAQRDFENHHKAVLVEFADTL